MLTLAVPGIGCFSQAIFVCDFFSFGGEIPGVGKVHLEVGGFAKCSIFLGTELDIFRSLKTVCKRREGHLKCEAYMDLEYAIARFPGEEPVDFVRIEPSPRQRGRRQR
jgi:hypothetical protein